VRDLLLEQTAPLPVPDGETLALAVNCLVAVAESLRALTLAAYGTPLPPQPTAAPAPQRTPQPNSGTLPPPPSSSPLRRSSGSGSGPALYFVPPPPSALVSRSASEQSLGAFLAAQDKSDAEGDCSPDDAAKEADAHPASPAPVRRLSQPRSVSSSVDDAAWPSASAPPAASAAQVRQRAAVRAFVTAVWENVLSAASQLLVHTHAAAAAHRSSGSNSGGSSTSVSGGGGATNPLTNTLAVATASAGSSGGHGSSSGSTSAAHRRLLDKLLTVYVAFAVSAGLAGLPMPRDCFLGSLCKAALPSPWLHAGSHGSADANQLALSPPHVAVLKVYYIRLPSSRYLRL
jgi:hypothetical protein